MIRLALLALLAGCPIAAGVPGLRADAGFATDRELTARVGAHVASFRKDRGVAWDLGAGASLNTPLAGAPSPTRLTANGLYLEGAWLGRITDAIRLSLGGGLAGVGPIDDQHVLGYVRAGVELFTPAEGSASGHDRCGAATAIWYGRSAIGVYADVSRAFDGPGLAAVVGLSARLPGIAGLGIGVPGCK